MTKKSIILKKTHDRNIIYALKLIVVVHVIILTKTCMISVIKEILKSVEICVPVQSFVG
jgi:hypothetical protein